MLKSIDVLIGLTVVVLALSMAVTVITQSLTTILNTRGKHLRRGLADLLQQLDPALSESIGKAVATRILTHPLVSGSSIPFVGRPRLGNVVHREEFTKLLIGMAAGQAADPVEEQARKALVEALSNNGVTNPEATLEGIRALSLELERSSPELSNMARQNVAILLGAKSDLVAKINTWFDQTMDRTSQRFTASTRAITFAAAFIVAFGLQADTPSIVNRLAADDALRAEFVREANTLNQQHQEVRGAAAAKPAGDPAVTQENTPQAPTTAPAAAPAPIASAAIEQQYRAFLLQNGIIKLPTSDGFLDGYDVSSCLGMLVTALLMSLGAPFWYSTLGQLLQLRSVLALKDDVQRTQRQSNEPALTPPSPAGAKVPSALQADRGTLADRVPRDSG